MAIVGRPAGVAAPFRGSGYGFSVCRSIKTLRPPYTEQVGAADVEAAALQYVRKIAGMRSPSTANAEAFAAAVEEVSAATQRLLDGLVLRPPRPAGDARAETAG